MNAGWGSRSRPAARGLTPMKGAIRVRSKTFRLPIWCMALIERGNECGMGTPCSEAGVGRSLQRGEGGGG